MRLLGQKEKTHEIKGLGTLRLPAALEVHGPRETPQSIVVEFGGVVDSFFWMGSHTPYRATFVVASNADANSEAFRNCTGIKWLSSEPSLGFGECVYEVNANKEPSWIVSARDPKRNLQMAYRIFKNASSREKAVAVVTGALANFQVSPEREAYMAELADRPRREAEAESRAEAAALEWFASKKLPFPELQKTQIIGDVAYVRWHRQTPMIDFLCYAGTAKPKSRYQVAEMRQFRDEWRIDNIENTFEYTPYDAFESRTWQPGLTYYFLRASFYFSAEGPDTGASMEEFLTACSGHF
ncbi:MAG: hypothetical protein FJW30_15740 [Acidobacteria bacterium]|nr:hypothetical protein [Acidobacteriota bacterium]